MLTISISIIIVVVLAWSMFLIYSWHMENERSLGRISNHSDDIGHYIKHPLDLSTSVNEEFVQPHVMQTILVESIGVDSYYRACDAVLQMLGDLNVNSGIPWLDGLRDRIVMYSRVSNIDVEVVVDIIGTHLSWPIEPWRVKEELRKFNEYRGEAM